MLSNKNIKKTNEISKVWKTSSYVTRSSWSKTALCFARYLSFSCFFFFPNIEQFICKLSSMKHFSCNYNILEFSTCSFLDFSSVWQAIRHSWKEKSMSSWRVWVEIKNSMNSIWTWRIVIVYHHQREEPSNWKGQN